MTYCYVNHSINTVPTFSCPGQDSASAAIEDVESEMKQIHLNRCANVMYNLTSFNVSITDIVTQLTCTVRYTAVGNSSAIYLEEPFVAFHDLKTIQTTYGSIERINTNYQGGRL